MPRETDGRWETKFGKFVIDYGAEKLAGEVEQTPACVYHWIGGRAFPRPQIAQQIVEISNGKLTLEDIYCPSNALPMVDRLEKSGFFGINKGDASHESR